MSLVAWQEFWRSEHGVEIGNETVHVFRQRRPACADAHFRHVGRFVFGEREDIFVGKAANHAVGENGELLVCRRWKFQGNAFRFERVADAHGLRDGMPRQLHVQVVFEKHFELYADQPAFCQQSAVLLDHVTESGIKARRRENDGFAEECAYFRSADVEHVAKAGNVGKRQVVVAGSQSVAHACSVDEKRQAMAAASRADGFKLGFRVDCSDFGGKRDVDHAGLHAMFGAGIAVVEFAHFVDRFRTQFPIDAFHGNDFVSGRLDGTCFVHGNMPCLDTNNALIRAKKGGYDSLVGLRAADEEMDGCVGCAASLFDQTAGIFAETIFPVARGLCHVGGGEPLQDSRMSALCIIAFKVDHVKKALCLARQRYCLLLQIRKYFLPDATSRRHSCV